MAGASGYADFPDVNNDTSATPTDAPPTSDALTSQTSSSDSDSPTADKPLLQAAATTPYMDMTAEGNIATPPTAGEPVIEVAPYLVSGCLRGLVYLPKAGRGNLHPASIVMKSCVIPF
jgi:hypothetical protein